MKNYKEFINENKDILEFPLKKFGSIIKDKIENKIKLNDNSFFFNFTNELTLPISFYIKINYSNIGYQYSAYVNKDDLYSNNFKNFSLNVNIKDKNIDYNQLYSLITHELKHVYDMYYDENTESLNNVSSYNYLRKKYSNNKFLLDFVELSNLALKHEVDARNRMIYDKLRWLKTYDDIQINNEFKKTYVYKSIIMLYNFNHLLIINNVNLTELLDFTNDFLNKFVNTNYIVKTKEDLINFYKSQENMFKSVSKQLLIDCQNILKELIKDKKPYMENKLFSMNDVIENDKELYIKEIIKELYNSYF